MISVAEIPKFMSDQIMSNLETLITTIFQPISTLFLPCRNVSIMSFMLYTTGTFLAITAPAWILLLITLYSNDKKKIRKTKKIDKYYNASTSFDVANDQVNVTMSHDQHAFSRVTKRKTVTSDAHYTENFRFSDAEYAEEIQLQESLMASILPSPIMNTSSSSVHRQNKNTSQVFCEICLENKRSWEMFTNDECTHSFCYECTTGHIMSKIEDKVETINCPSLNCNATLSYDDCRKMIPKDTLVKWDEVLCLSLIPESQKLYCPFRDCSSMLLNDSGEVLSNITCLACKRSFCAECRVPWHSEFTCKEFKKLYAKNGGRKDDKIVKSLAKKKHWQKCPKCKMYVEKAEGCLHITCRCKYEFCYRCGLKWGLSHDNCKPRSYLLANANRYLGLLAR